MADLFQEVAKRRAVVDQRNRAAHPVSTAALDAVITADDQDWYGMLCDTDGSFIFSYGDFAVALRLEEGPIPLWDLRAEAPWGTLAEIVHDLRQGLVRFLAHLDVMAARVSRRER